MLLCVFGQYSMLLCGFGQNGMMLCVMWILGVLFLTYLDEINPFGSVGKYIYHFIFLKFLDIKSKRNPKYFLDIK